MIFKEMSKEEMPELAALYVSAFNKAPWNDKWSIESASMRLTQMIDSVGSYGMSIYDDNGLIGMILGHSQHYYDGTYFEIKEFCVDNNKSGKGLGSQILTTFLEKLKKRNISKVFLVTYRVAETEGFYQKNGFMSVDNLLVMDKKLDLE